MQKRVRSFTILAMAALLAMSPCASLAESADRHTKQAGENRWVPSLVISGGVTIQRQRGAAASLIFEDLSPSPVPLRDSIVGDDNAVSPFFGVTLELMTPALPIATRPRFFVSGEILPTFASDRDLALQGDPTCVHGPEVDAVCVRDETVQRGRTFGEAEVNGEGSRTTAQVDTLVYGAKLGVSFPLQFRKRQLRIKPSVGWINYKVIATGNMVNAACDPVTACVDSGPFPPIDGFLRETNLTASDSQRFNGIGPSIEIELDTGQFGPIGTSILVGGGAYAILGDRTMAFGTSESYDDQIGMDVVVAAFAVDVDPWMYRGNVGIRFQWLGRKP